MGGSSWSDDSYYDRATTRSVTNTPVFKYDTDVRAGRVSSVHESLDPRKIKGVRESRDSDAHPESNSIVVCLDVTGSMARVVNEIHKSLPSLMGLLTRKNYIPHPQVMFMAVGDATCDRYPLQVGQFESGIEMEDNLSNVILEQGGGGQNTESYELGAYVGARKTSIDCFEKRGKKGYFFFIGDEKTYSKLDKEQVKELLGDTLEASVPTDQLFKELQEKYVTFFILPRDASNGGDSQIVKHWGELVGVEHVLKLDKAEATAELIATQIGLCEGTTDVDSAVEDLKANGTATALVKVVTDSLSKKYAGSAGLAKVDGTITPTGGSSITRL